MPNLGRSRSTTFYLCRPTLSLESGAGRLIRAQAEALRRNEQRVTVHCRRGGLKFFLRTGILPRRPPRAFEALAASAGSLLVDHGMRIPWADVVFVHNLLSEAVRHLEREDWRAGAAAEAEFYAAIDPDALVVANSELVRRGLIEHFGLRPGRVVVERPGFDRQRFAGPLARPALRREGRRRLGIDEATPLVGFVTSGDFRKRGLDVLLEAAERIGAARRDVRFLAVGSKRLPSWAAQHSLVQSGRMLYRPRSARPVPWFAALDVFLYPARFEEFGLVVSEALALGVPVLTSRRVGASECLPPEYAPWLLDAPDPARFAELTLALLADPAAGARLGELGASSAAPFDEARYVGATVGLMLERARAKAERTSKRGGR